jgi:protein O-GlcNAc transferase
MFDTAAIAGSLVRIQQLIRAGQFDTADRFCRELLQAAPDSPDAWFCFGVLSLRRNALLQAEDAFRRALAIQPNNPAILSQLSVALNKQGRSAEAENVARRAIALDASQADYWANLGNALYNQQLWAEAAQAQTQSLAIHPNDAAVWNNLGAAESKAGNLTAAQEAFERAMALAPGHTGAIANYACLLCQKGERDKASAWLPTALAIDLNSPQGWIAVGDMWQAMAEWNLADAAYRRVVELVPENENLRLQLLARRLGAPRSSTAVESVIREFLKERPQFAQGWTMLGETLAMQGRSSEAVPVMRHGVDLAADPVRHSRLLLGMQYAENITPAELLAAHREWDSNYALQLLPAPPVQLRGRPAAAPLRIGFVSGDFCRHPVGFLALPAVEFHDRAKCQVVCYSDRTGEDDYTARFRAAADVWRPAAGMSDRDLAEQIQTDQIDILLDLMGHAGKRLLVFASKPAPMQLTWLGYVGTTGLTAMDCLLADRFHVPAGDESHYSERVLHLPNGYACYAPPADAPQVGRLPAQSAGRVTFGSFNNPAKYSAGLLTAWAEILRQVPTAQLLLKYGELDDPHVQARLRGQFASLGIEPHRIQIEGRSPARELLAAYSRVDLALDTLPYSGGLTTCEALWMGVPVVTFPGSTFAGRHTTSHLTNAGYGQFIAGDWPGYIGTAVEWASRLEELASLRSQMREQVRGSPLCDAPRFAADFYTVLTAAFQSLIREPT